MAPYSPSKADDRNTFVGRDHSQMSDLQHASCNLLLMHFWHSASETEKVAKFVKFVDFRNAFNGRVEVGMHSNCSATI